MYTWLLFMLFPACTHHFMHSHVPCVGSYMQIGYSDAPDIVINYRNQRGTLYPVFTVCVCVLLLLSVCRCVHLSQTGQHCLHIAIINQNLRMVQELVERGADINAPRAVGTFFHPSAGKNSFYYGEHPVAFAACTGQADILQYLVDNGADLYVQDSHVSACVLLALVSLPGVRMVPLWLVVVERR